ncbi:unnamed protein product [Paramecium sonneborni]|uniref:Histone deacetylase domain-containing protein n=1 Tax=Paramecium sonneborni TaxID=65129 RepID=A0A8S1LWX4_9CILI|nr:unnamed protein product [Paramecium sonneborni]
MIQADLDSSRRVAYFYNRLIGKFHYGKEHPMKPKRIAMAHSLIVNFGLYRSLDVYLIREAQLEELNKFHDPEFVAYLSQYMSENKVNFVKEYCSTNYDGVIPENLLEEFRLITRWRQSKSSKNLNSDIKQEIQQIILLFQDYFLIVNLVQAQVQIVHIQYQQDRQIQQQIGLVDYTMLKRRRLLDFVIQMIQFCAYQNNQEYMLEYCMQILIVIMEMEQKVMTLSFHQYGDDFFPGTGQLNQVGLGVGKYYAVNVPLKPGISDQPYLELFKKVTSRVMETFRPDCVVMQCGTDSLIVQELQIYLLRVMDNVQLT